MTITRRGFLSLCALAVAPPPVAEPNVFLGAGSQAIKILKNSLYGKIVKRYSLALIPDTLERIAPGKVLILKATPDILFRPDRLFVSNPSFSLLHLGMNGEPLMEGEVPSSLFIEDYGTRIEMATLNPQEELVMAAVNRSKEPELFRAALIGTGIEENIPEE